MLRLVPRNDGGVDRAYRNACYPIWVQIGFIQSLIDAALIGSQRAASLENQRDAFERWAFPVAKKITFLVH